MGFLFWAGVGAVIGYVVAQRGGFATMAGVIAGAALGPLAIALFFVSLFISPAGQQRECPYCAGMVRAAARVCQHCHALLTTGWG